MNFSVIPTNLSSKTTKIGIIWHNALFPPTPYSSSSGERTAAANYWPIALTSHLSKIMERVVRKDIVDYLTASNLWIQDSMDQELDTQHCHNYCNITAIFWTLWKRGSTWLSSIWTSSRPLTGWTIVSSCQRSGPWGSMGTLVPGWALFYWTGHRKSRWRLTVWQ